MPRQSISRSVFSADEGALRLCLVGLRLDRGPKLPARGIIDRVGVAPHTADCSHYSRNRRTVAAEQYSRGRVVTRQRHTRAADHMSHIQAGEDALDQLLAELALHEAVVHN